MYVIVSSYGFGSPSYLEQARGDQCYLVVISSLAEPYVGTGRSKSTVKGTAYKKAIQGDVHSYCCLAV